MKYILQILFVFFIIFNFVSCDNGKKVKNNFVFSKRNLVFNNTNKENLGRTILAGLDELKIKHVVVLVLKINEPYFNNDYLVKANIEEINNHFYIIRMSDLSDSETLEVISHELIHLEQYKKDKLVTKDINIIWYGITYTPSEYEAVSYEERPWEHEAYQRQSRLSRRIKNRLSQ